MLLLTSFVLNLFFKFLFCIKTGPLKHIGVGKRLLNALITTETDMDFLTCIKSCASRRRCMSVNYMERFLLCELNYKNTSDGHTDMLATSDTVYSERNQWEADKLLSKSCRKKACSINEKCLEDKNGRAFCAISDCGFPREEKNATYDLKNGIGKYSKVTYSCKKEFYMKGKSYIGCQENGQWSTARFECLQVCKGGWSHFNSSCYMYMHEVSNSPMEFKNAKDECEKRGAHLADVLSKEEDHFIFELVGDAVPSTKHKTTLLGGIYNKDENQWKWIRSNWTFYGNGAGLYVNWDKKQPHTDGEEDCMGLYNSSSKWHDWKCNYQIQGFVCEKYT